MHLKCRSCGAKGYLPNPNLGQPPIEEEYLEYEEPEIGWDDEEEYYEVEEYEDEDYDEMDEDNDVSVIEWDE